MIKTVILFLLNYLIGSVNFACLFSKFIFKKDVRKIGFRTAGGSNVSQNFGIKWGLLVGFLDMIKTIPVLFYCRLNNFSEIEIYLIALGSIIGHCWPIWFNFSGGRGVASAVSNMIILNYRDALIPVAIFIFTIIPSLLRRIKGIQIKYISSPTLTLLALVIFVFIVIDTIPIYDDIYAILQLFIILFRRVTANFSEISKQKKLFGIILNRLIFDSDDLNK